MYFSSFFCFFSLYFFFFSLSCALFLSVRQHSSFIHQLFSIAAIVTRAMCALAFVMIISSHFRKTRFAFSIFPIITLWLLYNVQSKSSLLHSICYCCLTVTMLRLKSSSPSLSFSHSSIWLFDWEGNKNLLFLHLISMYQILNKRKTVIKHTHSNSPQSFAA